MTTLQREHFWSTDVLIIKGEKKNEINLHCGTNLQLLNHDSQEEEKDFYFIFCHQKWRPEVFIVSVALCIHVLDKKCGTFRKIKKQKEQNCIFVLIVLFFMSRQHDFNNNKIINKSDTALCLLKCKSVHFWFLKARTLGPAMRYFRFTQRFQYMLNVCLLYIGWTNIFNCFISWFNFFFSNLYTHIFIYIHRYINIHI